MATLKSLEVSKKQRNRGKARGVTNTASGTLRVGVAQTVTSIATTDLIQFLIMGENQRPTKATLAAIPVSGTPVLVNPTFNIGVADAHGGTFTRPDGSTYAVVTTDADQISAALVIPSDNMVVDTQVARPMATANFAPYYVTATPAGAGAFSVTGGVIDLVLTLEFAGETNGDALVYKTYIVSKVAN
jgi:hypothetical protein